MEAEGVMAAEMGARCTDAEHRAQQQQEEMGLLRAELSAAQQAMKDSDKDTQQRAKTALVVSKNGNNSGASSNNTPVKAPWGAGPVVSTPHQTPGSSAIKTPFSRSREAALLLEGNMTP